jgi:hypothetical protein
MHNHLTKRQTVFGALLLALFWVTTIWGIFSQGEDALGWNVTVYWLGVIALYAYSSGTKRWGKHELIWLLPLLLAAVSYSLYENPYIKGVNLLVMPLLFSTYWIITSTTHHQKVFWNFAWVKRLAERIVGFFNEIERALSMTAHALMPGGKDKGELAKRIALGLCIFAIVACVVFIPLLSGADSAFAKMMHDAYDAVVKIIAIETIMKVVVFVIITLLILAGNLHWAKEEEFSSHTETKHMDPVVSGIVLGGIFLLYILFLFTQVQSLWVQELPKEFLATEEIVKSGFWQLFILSGINVLLYLLYYRRTSKIVQHILTAFMFASLLLLLSGAKRMGMYVLTYGFSYEKFFAAYTVIFAIGLFIRLIVALLQKGRADIARYVMVTFVWMYAVVTVLPVEQLIFRANRALSTQPGSRVDMDEMWMMSGDVFSLVKELSKKEAGWEPWLNEQTISSDDKAFYELTITDLLVRSKSYAP